jgi:hypothetical protein
MLTDASRRGQASPRTPRRDRMGRPDTQTRCAPPKHFVVGDI